MSFPLAPGGRDWHVAIVVTRALLDLPDAPAASLRWLPDSDALASAVLDAALADTQQDASAVAEFLAAPVRELAASPISLRVAIGAANEGRSFVHLEQRCLVAMHEDLRSELDVGDESGGAHWEHGILAPPKYNSAFLDAPLPTYDPNHRNKWRPHELLHRLVRFSWRPDLSRFEAYLSARIGELLPVVHWYGFDELGRHHCAAHYGVTPSREHCPTCERECRPYWALEPSAATRAHTRRFAAEALEHFRDEVHACQRELETGRLYATPGARAGLDAASDAVGYLRGHWQRMTAWSFGAWVERFTLPGVDVFDSCAAHLEYVCAMAKGLLGEPWALQSATKREAQRTRRWLQDLGYRALITLERLDNEDADAHVLPVIDTLAKHCQALHTHALDHGTAASDAIALATMELEARLETVSGADCAGHASGNGAQVFAGGWLWLDANERSTDQLVQGLRSGLPRSMAGLPDDALRPRVASFAGHTSFAGPGSLAERFATFLCEATSTPEWAEAVRLEAWLRAEPLIDLEAERFGIVPDEATPTHGRLRLNSTLRRARFEAQAATAILDWGPSEHTHVELVATHFGGESRVIEGSAEVREALDAAEDGTWAGSAEIQDSLRNAGFLVWLPRPR